MLDRPFAQPRFQSTQSHFSRVPQADIPRSVFNRSHQFKTTFNSGLLIPIYVDEALPGDSFKLNVTTFARLATPVVPVMDNLYADVFFFFVPNRLIWNNWERFNGAQDDPGDSTDFLIPTMVSPAVTGYDVETLSDYFGIPTGVPGLQHSSMWHRAYNLIWNEWFRDQNLQNSVVVDKDDGPDSPSDYVLLRRGKRHDYFTSALPFTQKGPSVELPLGSIAPVYRVDNASPWKVYNSSSQTQTPSTSAIGVGTSGANQFLQSQAGAAPFVSLDPNGGLYTDLSSATASTINQLREAFQLQRMFERDARGGTRYIEILKSHFGVTSPDFRLQRPEYLGGGSTMVNTSPIPQTSSTDATTPQGNLAAMGVFSHHGVGFRKSFVEHGVILGLLSVRADLTYQQGLNRMFSRLTRFDFYWPALSHLGEQAVLNREIYAQGSVNPSADAGVFGYQERYAEYRYKPSLITGKFRSQYAQSLDVWHLAQEFGSLPTLGNTFIQENPPMDRVKAVTTEPDFLLDVVLDLTSARPMPIYSVPGLIDHF
ncbi:VP1 [Kummerowia striata gokushovirus]|nr:VP1 [Kummerowia striata gokushovirus]